MPKETRPEWFKMRARHEVLFNEIEPAAIGKAMKMALHYANTGEEPNETLLEDLQTRIVFNTIRSDIDDSFDDYANAVETGRQAALKRWLND